MPLETIFQILSYGAFQDIPHAIYARAGTYVIHLDSDFDDETDDYKDYFDVALIMSETPRDILMGTFRRRPCRRVYLGQISVKDIMFHVDKRISLRSAKLEAMIAAYNPSDSLDSELSREYPRHRDYPALLEPGFLQILARGTDFGTTVRVPRGLYVNVSEKVIGLLCEFDENVDDYKDYYDVHFVIGAAPHDVQMDSFRTENYQEQYLGRLAVEHITFDEMKYASLNSPACEAVSRESPDYEAMVALGAVVGIGTQSLKSPTLEALVANAIISPAS